VQEDLATITGRSRQSIGNLIAGKATMTAEAALALGVALGLDPAELLRLGAAYELWMSDADTRAVERGARLFDIAPVREMQKRGWISSTDDLDELERQLSEFFGSELTDDIPFPVATRRTAELSDLNISERAWCFRARQLAALLPTAEYSQEAIATAEKQLRRAAAFPKEGRKVARILSEAGIRFVVIEPLPSVRIDGAAFWLDEHRPVIAMSIRHDRLDNFWFTLMHEFAHIKHGDCYSVDTNLIPDGSNGIRILTASDAAELAANEAAAHTLVPKEEMDSFVRRLSPYYSAERIVQFAHKVKIHPAIIVGQLQHRGELGYSALRDFLVKIRSVVIETALTDGWGQNISPGLI
jgi:HTH-type transcriptional regulator / antitoxin HigA